MDYNATESVDMSVEVCVEIITGTVNQIATVEVETLSGTAIGAFVIKHVCIVVMKVKVEVETLCWYFN